MHKAGENFALPYAEGLRCKLNSKLPLFFLLQSGVKSQTYKREVFMKKNRWIAVISATVMALAAFGCKTDTETEYVDKKVDETAPANVTELTAQAKDRRILLTWKDAADSDVYGYEVSYSGTKPINRVVLPALDTTSMMVPPKAGGTYINGLTNGTEYTFTVKTVDTSGNKSEGVTVKGTPVAVDAGETLKIALTAFVPQENGYTGDKSNTKVTVKANITTASNVKKVVWKKDGSLIAKTLLADENAAAATETEDNAVWTFDITAQDESANGSYTVAAIDEAGREEAEQITIDNFDFTPPGKVKVTNAVYSSELSSIIINWTEPVDADYYHVDITFTTNDGISDSEPSQAETVNKGTSDKTFPDVDGEKAYYTFTFVTYDELGNQGAEYTHKVPVNTTVSNIPEGFVEVTGTTITGSESWTPRSSVFVRGRSITIPDMYVCDHEVTRGEFKELMGTDPSTASAYDKDGNKLTGDAVLNNPVNYVNWYAAIAYCNKLSLKENLIPCYSVSGVTDWENLAYSLIPTSSNSTWDELTYDKEADGYRLPTEAEWEWLARGGENYTYAGSNTVDDVAWYTTNKNDTGSREVKTKQANGYGLYDMSGNVYEWCYDWYGTVSSSTADTGASSGSYRVLRGGSWYNYDDYCRVSDRNYNSPNYRVSAFGFRVVRSSSK